MLLQDHFDMLNKKHEQRRLTVQMIISTLVKDPEAFTDLSNALNEGIRITLELESRKTMQYYHAMISALMLTNGKHKLNKDLKDNFIQQILEACKGKHSGAESDAMKKFSAMLEED